MVNKRPSSASKSQSSARTPARRGPPKTTQEGPLTTAQRRVLEAILFSIQQGQVPTIREIGSLLGLKSSATVFKHIRTLQTKGLITVNRKSRSIRIADPRQVKAALLASTPSTGSGSGPAPLFPNLRLDASGDIAGAHFLHTSTDEADVLPFPAAKPAAARGIPLVGAIAAGKPFESYADGFLPDGVGESGFYHEGAASTSSAQAATADSLPMNPNLFVDSGEVFALRVQGDSMINAGILDGDYVMIRKQSTVEEGEIAAVIINGEGTLKRWRTYSKEGKRNVRLHPENERFDPIDITEDEAKEVIVFGKYVGLVRGNLRFL